MFGFTKKEKLVEEKKEKEIKRQSKYKRVNVVFNIDEFQPIQDFLSSQNISLTQYVKQKLKDDMSQLNN